LRKLYYNGTVITMDDRLPRAEAVLTDGDRVLRVGSSGDLLSALGRKGIRYDLKGKTVVPAITDSHAHLFLYACGRGWIDLKGVRSAGDLISRIESRGATPVKKEWILGRGWDQNGMDDPALPTLHALDKVSGGRPLFLERICGHAALVNSVALERAGLGAGDPVPSGGRVVRDNGLVLDEAVNRVRAMMETPSRIRKKELMQETIRELLSMGIAGVHEMGMTPEALDIYRELSAGDDFRFRITGYLPGGDSSPDEISRQVSEAAEEENEYLSVPGVKLFADGSLGARSAALLEDYSDDPGNRGILVTDPEELRERIMTFHAHSIQTAVHAIGDRGNRVVLDIFQRVQDEYPDRGARHRIEHAQLVDSQDIPRFASAGVIPSVQFSHCVSDYPWVEARLGAERSGNAYPWRSLLESGARIVAGSDLPFENIINPVSGILAAVARTGAGGEPEGGWMPGESIPFEDALKAYTVNSAFASFTENRRGMIREGMDADFTVISGDISEIRPQRLPSVEVLSVVVAGETVYNRPGTRLKDSN